MTFEIVIAPMLGLGFAVHFLAPAFEIVVGPVVIRFGDSEWISRTGDDDEDSD